MMRRPAITKAMIAQATNSSASVKPRSLRRALNRRMARSGPRHEHRDHVHATLLIELTPPRNRLVEHRHLNQLAGRRAGRAGVVGDGRHPPVEALRHRDRKST